jgi:hypothetical protein
MGNNDGKLTPEQIANWRKVLPVMFGPFAPLMTDDEIQLLRDRLQERVEEERACREDGRR